MPALVTHGYALHTYYAGAVTQAKPPFGVLFNCVTNGRSDQCFLPSQTKTVGAEIMVDSQPLTRSNECQGGGVWEGGNTGVDGGLEDGLQPSRLDCHKKKSKRILNPDSVPVPKFDKRKR